MNIIELSDWGKGKSKEIVLLSSEVGLLLSFLLRS